MKKIIALVLTLVLCMGFAIPAAAAFPETWDEAKAKMNIESSLSGYKNSVQQKFSLYYEDHDWYTEKTTVVKEDFDGVSYNVLPSDGTITVSNVGGESDYFVYVGLRIYEKESSSKYVERYENMGGQGYNLRKRGFEPVIVDWRISGEYELVKLYAGQSVTITANDLLETVAYGTQELNPNAEYMFRITLYQEYPSVERYWYGNWCYVIDDEAAREIVLQGKNPDDPGNPFDDVPMDAYYHDAVLWALKKEITTGVSMTEFAPFATCTRGQVATFLWRAKKCPEPKTTENPFTDIQESDYYYKAILWAYENGITTGATETTFDPNGTCTSAHVVTFLWRSNGEPAADYEGTEYYAEAVAWAEREGLLEGTATPFAPENLSPRADIVTYLYRDMG